MNIIDALIQEFQQESATTRKVLERVPTEHFGWKPHEKSMTMGQLASHLAENLSWAEGTMKEDVWLMDMATYKPFVAANTNELLEKFDENLVKALESMKGDRKSVV